MAKFKNLKVVVSGQFGNGAEYKYGYPMIPNTEDPLNNWIKMDMVEKDPLDIRNYFPKINTSMFKMRVSTYGSYYALVAPCKYDTSGRNGFYSITLFVAKGTKYTGAQVRATLNELNEVLYEANNFDALANEAVEKCFEENGWIAAVQEPMIMPVKSVPAYKDAYREYETESDLDMIMQYSMQPEYTGCRWIYLVKQGIQPDSQLSKLTTRIRIKYDVECEDVDVKVNKKITVDGDILNIVYTKPNFEDKTLSVKVGTPDSNKYLTYSETKIIVKSAANAGITLEKSIKVMLFDTEGKAVRVIPRITVNDEPVSGSVVKVKDSDLGTKLRIKIVAGLFEDVEDEIEADRLVKAPQMRVTLKPRIGGVKLNISLGGKEFSCVDTIAPNDTLSQSLQRGSFNGYKVTRRPNSDEYDIDITSSRPSVIGGNDDVNAKNPFLMRVVIILLLFAVGLAGGVLLERSLSPDVVVSVASIDEEEPALIEEDAPEVQPAESVVAEQAPAAETKEVEVQETQSVDSKAVVNENTIASYDALSDDEKADLAYLKKENKWEPNKVKSQKFKEMFAKLNNGDIDCLIPLFSNLEDKYVNGYIKIVIANLPKLSPENREVSKKYLKVNEKGNIATSWAAKKIGELAQ